MRKYPRWKKNDDTLNLKNQFVYQSSYISGCGPAQTLLKKGSYGINPSSSSESRHSLIRISTSSLSNFSPSERRICSNSPSIIVPFSILSRISATYNLDDTVWYKIDFQPFGYVE